jgi:hypothetical protein
LELILQRSIGNINLGMSRDEILKVLGKPSYSDDDDIFGLEEFYNNYNIRVGYDKDSLICKNIGISSPAELIYREVDLLSLDWDDAVNFVRLLDPNCILQLDEDPQGCISHAIRLSIGSKESDDSEDLVVDTITIFSEDYWEDFERKQALFFDKMEASLPSEEECAREFASSDLLES